MEGQQAHGLHTSSVTPSTPVLPDLSQANAYYAHTENKFINVGLLQNQLLLSLLLYIFQTIGLNVMFVGRQRNNGNIIICTVLRL